ncbi:MAG TPA: hypothetical protein PLE74_10720 [Candidatus Cloacimonadota bacterium]|mgnify:CR=1 FL=1|nr:hypothetical protein [Candidatus Cloacimonadota bacterium]HPT72740.1 hypothetical protein [Candidatus Cloacimonadota bacterium]
MNINPIKFSRKNDSIGISEYDLPDVWLFTDFSDFGLRKLIWIPQEKVLVLGQSNELDESIVVDTAKLDGIRIVRRPTGGESVLITPEMVIISILFTHITGIQSSKIFQIMGSRIQGALEDLGIENISFKGISDLAIGNNKIMGSAIYRNPKLLFYHAVLNVGEEPKIVGKYLQHPKQEPEYRNGRTHEKFVTSLKKEGFDLSVQDVQKKLEEFLQESFI